MRSLLRDSALLCGIVLCLFLMRCSEDHRNNELRSDGRATDGAIATDPLADEGVDRSAGSTARDRDVAVSDLQAMRAEMMAELEAVRTRLNDGTRPKPEQDADEARAAVLAQGLERVDRALRLAELATDAAWADAADTTRRATEEVRVWWTQHRRRA